MKPFFKWIVFFCLMGLLFFPLTVILLFIEKDPFITKPTPLSLENVQRVKQIIQKNRPDLIKQKQIKQLTLSEEDLTLIVRYALSNGAGIPHPRSRVELTQGKFSAYATLKIPPTPLGSYINLGVVAEEKEGIVSLHSLKVGRISLPGGMVSPFLAGIHWFLLQQDPYKNLYQTRQAIRQVAIDNGFLTLRYEWDPSRARNLKEQMTTSLVPPDHQKRLVRYHNELAKQLNQTRGKPTSLVFFLPPLFAFAHGESRAGGDPVLENKALFQVLAAYVAGENLGSILSPDHKKQLARLKPTRIILHKRGDLAQHFLVSAALTVSASSLVANFLGTAKELDDSTSGSGFSFADLAADKAGVKIGEMAIANSDLARKLQEKMQKISREDEFMPAISHLPEGIMAIEFKTRYQDLDSTAYTLINSEIDQRLGKCLLYQN